MAPLEEIITQNIPRKCPACAKAFSSVIKPKRYLQKKALMILIIGIAISIAIVPLIFLGIYLIGYIVGGFLVVIVVLVGVSPGLALGFKAMSYPKILKLRCKHCQWAQDYLLVRRKQD